jgi:hypothetical protein
MRGGREGRRGGGAEDAGGAQAVRTRVPFATSAGGGAQRPAVRGEAAEPLFALRCWALGLEAGGLLPVRPAPDDPRA